MATPYEWMQDILACVISGISQTPGGAPSPSRAEIGNMVGEPSVCPCDGAVLINGSDIYLTDEQWPNPTRETDRPLPCAYSSAMRITAMYRKCLNVEGDGQGNAPPVTRVNAEAAELWAIGNSVWQHAICCAHGDDGWARTAGFGRVRVGRLQPVARGGGCSGFNISFTVEIPTCVDCD